MPGVGLCLSLWRGLWGGGAERIVGGAEVVDRERTAVPKWVRMAQVVWRAMLPRRSGR